MYKGISNQPKRRLKEHNKNECSGTRGKGPWNLIYTESFETRVLARKREKYFKSGSGREFLKILLNIPL